jgi:hypothetical protein
MFDPHKLDISDEFKQVISTLKGHDDKVGSPGSQLTIARSGTSTAPLPMFPSNGD